MTAPTLTVSPAPIASEHVEMWALIQRSQAGDREAFGLIWERYADTVFRFVYFRCGNRPLAEDLAGEVWLRALKRIGSFTYEGRDIGAWLVTIARNLVADHFKSSRYKLEFAGGDVVHADREDRDWWTHPESATEDYMASRDLMKAVKALNPEQQEVIVLRFFRGLPIAEIAQLLGINEGAVKARQYRATRHLGALLPEGFDPAGRKPLPMPYETRS